MAGTVGQSKRVAVHIDTASLSPNLPQTYGCLVSVILGVAAIRRERDGQRQACVNVQRERRLKTLPSKPPGTGQVGTPFDSTAGASSQRAPEESAKSSWGLAEQPVWWRVMGSPTNTQMAGT